MANTVEVIRTVKVNSKAYSSTETHSVDGVKVISFSVPALTNDVQIAETVDVSQLKVFEVTCSGDLTLETNSSSAPVNTIACKTAAPYLWTSGDGRTNPLTADVTAFYFSNAGASAVTCTMVIGLDSSL